MSFYSDPKCWMASRLTITCAQACLAACILAIPLKHSLEVCDICGKKVKFIACIEDTTVIK